MCLNPATRNTPKIHVAVRDHAYPSMWNRKLFVRVRGQPTNRRPRLGFRKDWTKTVFFFRFFRFIFALSEGFAREPSFIVYARTHQRKRDHHAEAETFLHYSANTAVVVRGK